jgi:hypothetical protein
MEDEREAEGDAALGSKGSKGNTAACQTVDSRNLGHGRGHSLGSSNDLPRTQVKGMGAGLVVLDENPKECSEVADFDE